MGTLPFGQFLACVHVDKKDLPPFVVEKMDAFVAEHGGEWDCWKGPNLKFTTVTWYPHEYVEWSFIERERDLPKLVDDRIKEMYESYNYCD